MTPELTEFVRTYPGHCLMGLALVATVGIVQAARTWRTRTEREYKLTLIEYGLSVDDIERLTAGGRRRTPFEQFAALSGGAKAGIVIGGVLIANMVMAAAIAITTGHGGLSHVNYQQVGRPPATTPALKPAPAAGPMPPAAVDGEVADDENGC
jgi:hypothetical protein